MNAIISILIIAIMLSPLGIIIYIFLNEIIEYFKMRKYMKESDKAIFEFLVVMLIAPFIIYCMDRYNLFSKLKLNDNITSAYDWLSFIATYISTFVSAMLLIYVTRKDREENNENVREAQRPCLCTRIYLPNNFRMTEKSLDGYIWQDNDEKNTSGYYMVRVSNFGQTVAIIDTEKSYLIVERIKDKMIKISKKRSKIETILEEEKVYLNKYEDRLQINSNGKAELVITDDGMYRNIEEHEKANIKEVYVEYTDLFGKRYKDYIKIENGKTKVISDNEVLNISSK